MDHGEKRQAGTLCEDPVCTCALLPGLCSVALAWLPGGPCSPHAGFLLASLPLFTCAVGSSMGIDFITAPVVGYPEGFSFLHLLGGSNHKCAFSLPI